MLLDLMLAPPCRFHGVVASATLAPMSLPPCWNNSDLVFGSFSCALHLLAMVVEEDKLSGTLFPRSFAGDSVLAGTRLLLPSADHRGDGRLGNRWLLLCAETEKPGFMAASLKIFGSSSSVASSTATTVQLLNPLAVGRPLPPLSLTTKFYCWRDVLFNLQALVPKWRPSNSDAVCSCRCTPSGLVPGGVVVDRARLLRQDSGGEGARRRPGLDCFFIFFI